MKALREKQRAWEKQSDIKLSIVLIIGVMIWAAVTVCGVARLTTPNPQGQTVGQDLIKELAPAGDTIPARDRYDCLHVDLKDELDHIANVELGPIK